MGSDWDYINEHMGGFDEDGLPNFMSEPGFADDSEEDSDGDYFPKKKPSLKHNNGFIVDDSDWEYSAKKNKNEVYEKLVFETLDEVKNYAMTYPGICFTRSVKGHGYIIKNTINISHSIPKHIENIRKGKPPRSHFPWEYKEVAQLIKTFKSGKQIHEIAIELERSLRSIPGQLNILGLITTEECQNMINSPEFQPSCNKLFEIFMNNSYVAVNLLSRFYPFDKSLICKYAAILNFQELSSSEYVKWDSVLIEKYVDRWSWYKLSNNKTLPWSESLIIKYEKYWTWGYSKKRREPAYDGSGGCLIFTDYYYGLSNNESIPWTESLIERYKENFSWGRSVINESIFTASHGAKKLIFSNNKSLPWSETLIEKFIDKWNWDFLSYSEFLPWSEELIEKFYSKWDWYSLSANESIPWSEALIEKYENRLKWNWLSSNNSLPWSEAFIEKYKDKWHWDKLSRDKLLPWTEALIEKYKNTLWNLSEDESLPWSESLIERYKDKWDLGGDYTGGLSSNEALPWSEELIEKYIDKWNFGEDRQGGLSSNEALPWSEAFFEKYIDKWHFNRDESDPECEWHGGINRNSSLPWSATFIEKHKDKWNWYHLIENYGLLWDETLMEMFISRHCYPPQNNTEVHKLIKELNPSQVQVILENHKIS